MRYFIGIHRGQQVCAVYRSRISRLSAAYLPSAAIGTTAYQIIERQISRKFHATNLPMETGVQSAIELTLKWTPIFGQRMGLNKR